MSKTTRVYFNGIWETNNTSHIFRTIGNETIQSLWVEEFDDGIVTVEPGFGYSINSFAEAISGCFNADSNFGTEVLRAYDCENDTFKGIKFEFNGAVITVTKENSDVDRIIQEYHAELEANEEKRQLEREAWLKTSEGKEYLAQQKAEEVRKDLLKAEVLHIDETSEIEFKNEEGRIAWNQIVENNSKNSYSYSVVKYARRWAKYMQKLIAEGKNVEEIAEKASHDCDIDGITGFQHDCALNVLAQCWKYGAELRK